MTGDNKIERPGELPALVLAYVGDAVYELLIREHLVRAGLVRVDRLHGEAVKYVQAAAQARTLRALEGSLSEERWRWSAAAATQISPPPQFRVIEYRHSTALKPGGLPLP